MPRKISLITALTAITALLGTSGLLAQGPNPRPGVWADCQAYGSVVTKGTFTPDHDNFDELYGGTSFKNGMPLISDSAPGDTDYNGGRWHLNVLKGGVDPGKYSDACSVGDLDLSDFESTDQYFECPLMPQRNQ